MLAFARHLGVFQAVAARGLVVDGGVGTSSGAHVGALWAAGVDHARLAPVVAFRRPLSLVSLHLRPREEAFRPAPLVARLRAHLPHLVDRRRDVLDGLGDVPIVRTPRSGASFWSLGDVPAAVARERAASVLAGV